MKKLFITLLSCAAAGLFAADADIITPPAGKTITIPMENKMTTQAGGFVIDFTLNFNDPAKDYVGYMVSSRNWRKPFCGFAFGINRIKNLTAIWFYPLDENGKVFGFYQKCDLVSGKRYQAELSYNGRHCTLKIDGKELASATFKKDITIFDKIEIGGLGGKPRDITIHSFKFLDVKKK